MILDRGVVLGRAQSDTESFLSNSNPMISTQRRVRRLRSAPSVYVFLCSFLFPRLSTAMRGMHPGRASRGIPRGTLFQNVFLGDTRRQIRRNESQLPSVENRPLKDEEMLQLLRGATIP